MTNQKTLAELYAEAKQKDPGSLFIEQCDQSETFRKAMMAQLGDPRVPNHPDIEEGLLRIINVY